ncbi:MAG TPA: hypothetical protein VMU94_21260 [Streptosporangiaceae bacterium]|nr:hypothetical protein [Streptosporangiaceae bacterium]
MNSITAAQARLETAEDLPTILNAAYEAFDAMLPVIHDHQDPAGGSFVTFVMSATYAANGRDAVGFAPSLPSAAIPPAPEHPAEKGSALEAATALASLSQLLASRLVSAGQRATTQSDRIACTVAAHQATRLWSLLAQAAGL